MQRIMIVGGPGSGKSTLARPEMPANGSELLDTAFLAEAVF